MPRIVRTLRRILSGTAIASLAIAAGLTQPSMALGADLQDRTVVSGDARFEVLSDTLFRVEYAPGGTDLTDAATFNAIGRDDFTPVSFETTTAGGWLTITTDRAELKYRVGTGKFAADNLRLTVDGTEVRPTFGRVDQCQIDRICEAEEGQLYNLGVESEHLGFTGRGFVAGWGNSTTHGAYQFVAPATGIYDLHVRYANGGAASRTLSYTFDNAPLSRVTLPALTAQAPETNNWKAWGTAVIEDVPLTVGPHNFYLVRTGSDTGSVNVDAFALTAPGAPYPAAQPASCSFGIACEAEAGTMSGAVKREYDHADYSGSGFAGGFLATGAKTSLAVTGVPAAGRYWAHVRYANGPTTLTTAVDRAVTIGGTRVVLPSTGSNDAAWGNWTDFSFELELNAGTNPLDIERTSTDDGSVNIDSIAITDSPTPPPAHVQIGGYVRSLDNVDKQTTLAPGLLYRDGWMLLDDTVTSLWDPQALSATDRNIHHADYQDGYLFSYGHDFKAALQDLRTLTGPSKLLPRWAYGVWFSEYRDFSQDDYEHNIIDKFAAENVPLDALVSDTDFKKLNKWNGWEFDEARFPDPQGFFEYSADRGIANVLNIHATIDTRDPLYEQYLDDVDAAGGNSANVKLDEPGEGCRMFGSYPASVKCATFDWSDPAQLSAYMKLHDGMDDLGADLWWLDWSTADYSSASGQGYGDDAFINEQYAGQKGYLVNVADDTPSSATARGFGFSRTYGDNLTPLQSGIWNDPSKVPVYGANGPSYGAVVGPWADKRSTAHFTGDARSTFNSLRSQISFTADESATTGMSAVSHDIGGFQQADGLFQVGDDAQRRLWDDLYIRWLQFGVFQPILRLHGDHSARMPWQYTPSSVPAASAAVEPAAKDFLRLRNRLMPYIYTAAKQAEDTGLPVVRAMYLEHPQENLAYQYSKSQYYFGDDLLVAPITGVGNPASTTVWFPAGTWTDFFTGEKFTSDGTRTETITRSFAQMPVFIRDGGIVTTRSTAVTNDHLNPLDQVTVTVGSGSSGEAEMYEDDGETANPTASARTGITYAESAAGASLDVAATQGTFSGQVANRAWTAVFTGLDEAPAAVWLDGQQADAAQWTFDAASGRLTVQAGTKSPSATTTVRYTRHDAPVATVNLTVSGGSHLVGDTVTLTASVTPNTASGEITFHDGTQIIGHSPLNAGIATLPVTLTAGSHQFRATYAGSPDVLAGSSQTVTVVAAVACLAGAAIPPCGPDGPGSETPAVSAATLSATKQTYGAKRPATITVVTTGTTGGTLRVKLGSDSLGTKPVAAIGTRKGAVFALPRTLGAGKYATLSVELVPSGKTTTVRRTFAANFTVVKARPASIKAKRLASPAKAGPRLRITVKRLTNGSLPAGRVQVLRGKKVLKSVKLPAKRKGKVTITLARKYAKVKSVKVRFMPTNKDSRNIAKVTSRKVALR
ncbi:TIM-barrel domain-containing protein [Rarobacter faecitabidus]|nr:TIM-barrel domain-containing protein [Rarobacter faecitabidus]